MWVPDAAPAAPPPSTFSALVVQEEQRRAASAVHSALCLGKPKAALRPAKRDRADSLEPQLLPVAVKHERGDDAPLAPLAAGEKHKRQCMRQQPQQWQQAERQQQQHGHLAEQHLQGKQQSPPLLLLLLQQWRRQPEQPEQQQQEQPDREEGAPPLKWDALVQNEHGNWRLPAAAPKTVRSVQAEVAAAAALAAPTAAAPPTPKPTPTQVAPSPAGAAAAGVPRVHAAVEAPLPASAPSPSPPPPKRASPPAARTGRPPRPQGAAARLAPQHPPQPQKEAARAQRSQDQQQPLSRRLLKKLPAAPIAALVARHPLLPPLCQVLDSFSTLAPKLGLPMELRLSQSEVVNAASWLLELNVQNQMLLAPHPSELCMLVAAVASIQQVHLERLAHMRGLVQGLVEHAVCRLVANEGTLSGLDLAAMAPSLPLLNIRTQLRTHCWEHLKRQQPELARQLIEKMEGRQAQQKNEGARPPLPEQQQQQQQQQHVGCETAAQQLGEGCGQEGVGPAQHLPRPLTPRSAKGAALAEQPTSSAPSGRQECEGEQADVAVTELERSVLRLLREDASVARRFQRYFGKCREADAALAAREPAGAAAAGDGAKEPAGDTGASGDGTTKPAAPAGCLEQQQQQKQPAVGAAAPSAADGCAGKSGWVVEAEQRMQRLKDLLAG